MPNYDSPFGAPLPTNLPKPMGLPAPVQVQHTQQQMPMPLDMQPRQAPQFAAPQRSEFESLMSGVGGLFKQERENDEKKTAAETAKTLLEELAALKSQRDAGPMNSDGAKRPAMDGVPADMDDYMARNAKFESGANENAVNAGSGATGLFQFLPSTWRWIAKEAPELGLTDEGMKTREQQMKAMRYYTQKSVNTLTPILGRKPTGGELYLLHLLGHSGGPAVLADLDAPITKTISEGAYRGNPFLKQYGTGRDLIAGLNRQFGGAKE